MGAELSQQVRFGGFPAPKCQRRLWTDVHREDWVPRERPTLTVNQAWDISASTGQASHIWEIAWRAGIGARQSRGAFAKPKREISNLRRRGQPVRSVRGDGDNHDRHGATALKAEPRGGKRDTGASFRGAADATQESVVRRRRRPAYTMARLETAPDLRRRGKSAVILRKPRPLLPSQATSAYELEQEANRDQQGCAWIASTCCDLRWPGETAHQPARTRSETPETSPSPRR